MKELKNFLDKNQKLKIFPSKKNDKLIALEYLINKFDKNKKYTEKEVNELLNEYHVFNDPALLRRELYDNYLINRSVDGKTYFIKDY